MATSEWCASCAAYTPRPGCTANECLRCADRLLDAIAAAPAPPEECHECGGGLRIRRERGYPLMLWCPCGYERLVYEGE